MEGRQSGVTAKGQDMGYTFSSHMKRQFCGVVFCRRVASAQVPSEQQKPEESKVNLKEKHLLKTNC